MSCLFKKRLSLAAVSVLVSGCASTYQVPAASPMATLSVRSPQGYVVSASTYEDSSTCQSRRVLKDPKGKAAVKSFQLEPSSNVVITVGITEKNVIGYSCHFSLAMPIEAGEHYVVNAVADQGRRVCNNKLVNLKDKAKIPLLRIVKTKMPFHLITGEQQSCGDMTKVASKDGRFESTIYFNNAQYTGYSTKEAKSKR